MIIKSQQIGYARMYFCNVLYPKPYYEFKESKEFIWRLKRFICIFFFFEIYSVAFLDPYVSFSVEGYKIILAFRYDFFGFYIFIQTRLFSTILSHNPFITVNGTY